MTRINIALPKELLNELEVLKDNGYTSRTKGLQDAIKDYINQHQTHLPNKL